MYTLISFINVFLSIKSQKFTYVVFDQIDVGRLFEYGFKKD